MHDYISRLIACGMPRTVALCVCRDYKRRGDLPGLALYVEAVEDESRVKLEAV